MEIYNCKQGEDEWFAAKLGIPSASNFSKVIASGKGITRQGYIYKLAAEILTGQQQTSYSNANMDRGTELEPAARDDYELVTGNEVKQVGFVLNGKIGCSPDGLIDLDGGLEVKCPLPSTHIATVMSGIIPSEHKPQMQGSMLVTERKWWDFCSYCPEIDGKYIFIRRMMRDEKYITDLKSKINDFIEDLEYIVKSMKNK